MESIEASINAPPTTLVFVQFGAAARLDPEEKRVILSVIESVILRNTIKEAARRLANTDSGGSR